MSRWYEVVANLINAVSILLAGLNSIHTWWTGILGCIVFALVFFNAKLYADLTLQGFFIITSIIGWSAWLGRRDGVELPVRRTSGPTTITLLIFASAVAAGYGFLLHKFTDAYAPFIDSIVLAFSVLGQCLLMGRRYESWWCWVLVNTIAVPLYISRGLMVTAVLYFAFWLNSLLALRRWRRLASQV